MPKVGFNILVESEYVKVLEAYGKFRGTTNKTEAFRLLMRYINQRLGFCLVLPKEADIIGC